jgi:cytochrome c-type biogenesis protein CcmH/NrfF
MRRLAALAAAATLVFAPSALASTAPRASLLTLEGELVCVTCHETINMSTSPLAEQMKAYIRRFIAEGWTNQQILHYFVVTAGMGQAVLADPPTHGFNLFAWVIPFAVIGGGVVAVAGGAYVWSRNRDGDEGGAGMVAAAAGPPLGPGLDLRVDQELARFDA